MCHIIYTISCIDTDTDNDITNIPESIYTCNVEHMHT